MASIPRALQVALASAIALALLRMSNKLQFITQHCEIATFVWRKPASSMSISLEDTNIPELRHGLDRGRFTVSELVETFVKRIDELNPQVHAVSQVNPDAADIARSKDEELQRGERKGKLHGIPILVKDLFLTTDRLASTNGCHGLRHAVPKFEATVIKRLREQGSVLLGKTVPTEWANYRSPGRASGGWSAVGGQCVAPYHKDQDPSGSSSGSAVAVALGLAAAALGTETSGSLSSPAQKAAVVSIKPTVGLTSRHGTYPVSEWQDTVGVLARSVCDAAIVLTAISGSDDQDPFTVSDPRDREGVKKPAVGTDFSDACQVSGLKGKRIAIPRHLFPVDAVVTAAFDEALSVVKSLGATIVDDVKFSEFNANFTYSDETPWTLGLRVTLRENMKKFLAHYEVNPESLHNLEDLINYTKNTPEEENDKWGADEWVKCEKFAKEYPPSSKEYQDSLAWRHSIGTQIAELLDRTECDFIFVPSTVDTSANVGGCPTIGVPLGFYPEDTPVSRRKSSGLVTIGPNVPFGALFVGRRWDDYNLISAAFAYEQASQIRKKKSPVISSDIKLPVKNDAAIQPPLALL